MTSTRTLTLCPKPAPTQEFNIKSYPAIYFFGRDKDDWPEHFKRMGDSEETLVEYATTQWEIQGPVPAVRPAATVEFDY